MPNPNDLFFLFANQKETPKIRKFYGETAGNGSIIVPKDLIVGSLVFLFRETYGSGGGANTQEIPNWTNIANGSGYWVDVTPSPNVRYYTTGSVFVKQIKSYDRGSLLDPIDNTNNAGSYMFLELSDFIAEDVDISKIVQSTDYGSGVSLTLTDRSSIKNILFYAYFRGRNGTRTAADISVSFSQDSSKFTPITYFQDNAQQYVNVLVYEYNPTELSGNVIVTDNVGSSSVTSIMSVPL